MSAFTKEDLKSAFEAGQMAAEFNNDLDDLLNRGTKQAPERQSFETWFDVFTESEVNFKSYSNKNGGWIEPNGFCG